MAEKKTKEYPVPEEIRDLFDDKNAASDLRDVYAKLPFGFKKASKCARDAQRLETKAWRKVYEIYPELIGIELTHWAGTIKKGASNG